MNSQIQSTMPSPSFNTVYHSDVRFLHYEKPNDQMIEVLHVPTDYKEWVRIIDTIDNCYLIHYLTPNDTVDAKNDILENVGHVRGIILIKENDKYTIICKSMPYTPEIVIDDEFQFEEWDNYTKWHAWEGTVIRLFYSNTEWYIATHRKINAYNSFVCPKSFGELFEDILHFKNVSQDFVNELNTDIVYSFIITHPKNVILLPVDLQKKDIMIANAYNKTSFVKENVHTIHLPSNITRPLEYKGTFDDMKKEIHSMKSVHSCGIFLQKNDTYLKFISPYYKNLKNLRGNNPSIGHRYVEMRQQNEQLKLEEWFTDDINRTRINEMKQKYDALVTKLHKLYISRFIKKVIREMPKEEFVTIHRCHQWYKEHSSSGSIVVRSVVEDILKDAPYHCLLRMLNRVTIQ